LVEEFSKIGSGRWLKSIGNFDQLLSSAKASGFSTKASDTFRSPVPADIPFAAIVPALPRGRPSGIGFPSQAAIELPQILRAPSLNCRASPN